MYIEEGKYFHELHVASLTGAVVILDIDGTLTCSSSMHVSDAVRDTISRFQKENVVYIFSNNYNGQRSRAIAQDLGLPYIEAPHKKPNKKILHYIDHGTAPIIAIGDKYLTDGLFAQFTRVRHIRVRRYRCPQDSLVDRAACVFDDIMYRIARMAGVVCTKVKE